MQNTPIYRPRSVYFPTTLLIITAGLASRKFSCIFPNFINDYLGDMLWAMMIYSMFSLIFNRAKIRNIASAALLFCFFIELSQLYHRPWIDAIRHTRLGGLILGFGFLWTDLIAYSIGVALCLIIERSFFYKK